MKWETVLCLINEVIDDKISELEWDADAYRENHIGTPPIGELPMEKRITRLEEAKEILNKRPISFTESLK